MTFSNGYGKSSEPLRSALQLAYEDLADAAIDSREGWAEGWIDGGVVMAITEERYQEFVKEFGPDDKSEKSPFIIAREDGWVVRFYSVPEKYRSLLPRLHRR